MHLRDIVHPERRSRLTHSLLVTIAVALLWVNNPSYQPVTKVFAQDSIPQVVGPGSRPATIEEAGPIAKLSGRGSCTVSIMATEEIIAQEEATNTFITAEHCVNSNSIDSQLNPGYLSIDPATDESTKKYYVAKILQPGVSFDKNPDVVVGVLQEKIPLIGDVTAIPITSTIPIPTDTPLATIGYGTQLDNSRPTWPVFGNVEIDTTSQACGDFPNTLVSIPSETHITRGDSGGFMGPIYVNENGELVFSQKGVTSKICSDEFAPKVVTGFESLESAEMQESLIQIIEEANQQDSYQEVPLTTTSSQILETGQELKSSNLSLETITDLSPKTETIVFTHYQDPALETSVSLSSASLEVTGDTECVEVTQETPSLPLVFTNGENSSVRTTIKSICDIGPFHIKSANVRQKFELTKQTTDGQLIAEVEKEELISLMSPLKIDPDTLTASPQSIYTKDTKKGLITINASKDDSQVLLEITSQLWYPTLYYKIINIPEAQGLAAFESQEISWELSEFSEGPVTTSISIPLPEEIIPPQTTHLPLLGKN